MPAEVLSAGLAAPVPLARGTLGRRLIVRVTALVALLTLAVTAATALATWQVLTRQVDGQLTSISNRLRDPGSGSGRPDRLIGPGQPFGTIAAVFDADDTLLQGARLVEERGTGRGGQAESLDTPVIAQLAALELDGQPTTVRLEGLGRYRAVSFRVTAGGRTIGSIVFAVPLRDVDHALIELVGLAAGLSGLAIVGTVFASRALVVRSLRPLNRVAATAQQVSQLPLDRGEVALAVRVAPDDADPASEVGRVGQALNHLLANVEDALAARQASETRVRQFVADASHELRNPLAAIRGYAELTRRDRQEMPARAAYALERVESEAERMSHLVEDLLLLARLDSGPALAVTAVDLSELVINAVSDARAAGRDHVWQLSLPEEPVSALGDAHRLHQVVANLLANARTHTPAGTQVRTSVLVDRDSAVVTVTDNGPGIPDQIQDQVFERFTRADTARVRAAGAAQGRSTGLGLAIVAAVVDAHQGSVQVTSEPGRTEFVVRLPLAVLEAPPYDGPGPDMRPPV